MEPKKNEIQRTEQASPNEMIKLAIEGNADLEKLEKLLDLQERYEGNEARKVFSSDFSVVQANIAVVTKTKSNPQTSSKYAGLDDVLEMSKPVYTKQGFSIIFYEGKTDVAENVRVCADVLHKAGHKETYHLDVPLGGVGIKGVVNMTKIHAKATSITYGRRYLLCMIWNIPTQDDDGAGAGKGTPDIPELTKVNKECLIKIHETLQKTLAKGEMVDMDKVAGIFLGRKGYYPSDPARTGVAASWLISLKRKDGWVIKGTKKPTPPKVKPMDIVKQAFLEFEMENQNYLAEGFQYDEDRFIRAVYKEFDALPTNPKEVKKILETIKPQDVMIEEKEE